MGRKKKDKQSKIEHRKQYHANRMATDPIYVLKGKLRTLIGVSFWSGFTGTTQFIEIVGCTPDEFKNHLESQFEDWMTWDNKGKYDGNFKCGWDMDHIVPLGLATTEDQVKALNHYMNIRPKCSKLNRNIQRNDIISKLLDHIKDDKDIIKWFK